MIFVIMNNMFVNYINYKRYIINNILKIIASILKACCKGCSNIEKIGEKWIRAPGNCCGNMLNGSPIDCSCL